MYAVSLERLVVVLWYFVRLTLSHEHRRYRHWCTLVVCRPCMTLVSETRFSLKRKNWNWADFALLLQYLGGLSLNFTTFCCRSRVCNGCRLCMKSTSMLKSDKVFINITYALFWKFTTWRKRLRRNLTTDIYSYFCSSLIVRNENCISTKSIYKKTKWDRKSVV